MARANEVKAKQRRCDFKCRAPGAKTAARTFQSAATLKGRSASRSPEPRNIRKLLRTGKSALLAFTPANSLALIRSPRFVDADEAAKRDQADGRYACG